MGNGPTLDHLERPLIPDTLKSEIDQAFTSIEPGKRGALLILTDREGTRAHLAARLGDHWKVAAGGGFKWDGAWTTGAAVAASW